MNEPHTIPTKKVYALDYVINRPHMVLSTYDMLQILAKAQGKTDIHYLSDLLNIEIDTAYRYKREMKAYGKYTKTCAWRIDETWKAFCSGAYRNIFKDKIKQYCKEKLNMEIVDTITEEKMKVNSKLENQMKVLSSMGKLEICFSNINNTFVLYYKHHNGAIITAREDSTLSIILDELAIKVKDSLINLRNKTKNDLDKMNQDVDAILEVCDE